VTGEELWLGFTLAPPYRYYGTPAKGGGEPNKIKGERPSSRNKVGKKGSGSRGKEVHVGGKRPGGEKVLERNS